VSSNLKDQLQNFQNVVMHSVFQRMQPSISIMIIKIAMNHQTNSQPREKLIVGPGYSRRKNIRGKASSKIKCHYQGQGPRTLTQQLELVCSPPRASHRPAQSATDPETHAQSPELWNGVRTQRNMTQPRPGPGGCPVPKILLEGT
jgi:hypothetical protein